MLSYLILLTGCNPQDAELTNASWYAFIAANSSNLVRDEVLPFVTMDKSDEDYPEDAPNVTIIECSERGWDKTLQEWDDTYIGPKIGDDQEQTEIANYDWENDNIIGGNCGCEVENADGFEVENTLDCSDDVNWTNAIGVTNVEKLQNVFQKCPMKRECRDIMSSSFYTFLQTDGYYRLNQDVKPWRSEAIINGEGHLQLTVHHELPGGEDFRFNFVIDPDFQPVVCTTDTQDQAKVEYYDGSDWLTRWSQDEEGHNIYYLNAYSYQLDPSDSDTYWYLVNEWNSGFGMARFAGEEFASIPTWYGNYENDTTKGFMYAENRSNVNIDGYKTKIYGYDPETEEEPDFSETALADLPYQQQFNAWAKEMNNFSFALTENDTACDTDADCDDGSYCAEPFPLIQDAEGNPNEQGVCKTSQFKHKLEDNLWRPVNTTNGGMDGWAELNSSWVRVKNSSEITAGGKVEGDFQIVYQAMESNSRLMVKGSFSIDDLREDPWAYEFFPNLKRLENDAEFCNGATLGE